MAGWGSEPAGGEGHGGCYDNFVMVFDRYGDHQDLILWTSLHAYYYAEHMYCLHRGPVVLLRTEFGVLSRGKVGPTELVSEYLRSGKTNEVQYVVRCVCDNNSCTVHVLSVLHA